MRISDALAGLRATARRARSAVPDTTFSVAVTAVFLVVGATTAVHHEMWRDEIQSWLLARDSSGPIELWSRLRSEGHPGLWHLGLMPLTRLTWNPAIMQGLHLLIAATAVFVFCAHSPFTRLQKTLFAFGYFVLYEYSIICRNYGLGMLLLCLFAAAYRERRTRPFRPAVALFLLAHTSVHGLILSIALLGALFLDHLLSTLTEGAGAPLRRARVWMSMLVVVAGIGTSTLHLNRKWWPVWPLTLFVSGSTRPGPKAEWKPADAKRYVTLVTSAYLAVPEAKRHFWGSNRLEETNWFAGEVYNTYRFRVAFGMAVLFAITLLTRPSAFLVFSVGTFGLLAFFYFTHVESVRHHGFLYLVLITAYWIGRSAWTSQRTTWGFVDKWLWRAGGVALTGIMLVQVWGGVTAVRMERKYVFSQGKAVAEYLRENGLAEKLIIGHAEPSVTVLGYLRSKHRFYYAEDARFGSFVVRRGRERPASDGRIVAFAREFADDALVIRQRPWPKESRLRHGVEELASFPGASVESFFLYRITAASHASDE